MIQSMDNTWYVAIIKMGGTYSSFKAQHGQDYGSFSQRTNGKGHQVVAEEFFVSDSAVRELERPENGNGQWSRFDRL